MTWPWPGPGAVPGACRPGLLSPPATSARTQTAQLADGALDATCSVSPCASAPLLSLHAPWAPEGHCSHPRRQLDAPPGPRSCSLGSLHISHCAFTTTSPLVSGAAHRSGQGGRTSGWTERCVTPACPWWPASPGSAKDLVARPDSRLNVNPSCRAPGAGLGVPTPHPILGLHRSHPAAGAGSGVSPTSTSPWSPAPWGPADGDTWDPVSRLCTSSLLQGHSSSVPEPRE